MTGPLPLHCAHTFIVYICISTSALQIGSNLEINPHIYSHLLLLLCCHIHVGPGLAGGGGFRVESKESSPGASSEVDGLRSLLLKVRPSGRPHADPCPSPLSFQFGVPAVCWGRLWGVHL